MDIFLRRSKYTRLLIVAGLVVLIDQVTKYLIVIRLPLFQSIEVIPGFFDITHIHNPGGAFGFLADQSSGLRTIIFFFVSVLAVVLILWFYHNTPPSHPLLATGFALIFGGAVGNIIDRIRMGKVIDFLDVYIRNYHWPAFNVADSAITIGIGIFIMHLLLKRMPE